MEAQSFVLTVEASGEVVPAGGQQSEADEPCEEESTDG
ncbi:hypothetical protein S1361_06400 [Streptomyces cyanogenus]|uniref:Uncharacterized protein n=1 Tax=Streptomyces cyanogenus TaxID=80860 RepID=A0ABX7TNT1_STRCY|nr:hypothetical protein S1361_06400 [Streptomyces cyanogenus]